MGTGLGALLMLAVAACEQKPTVNLIDVEKITPQDISWLESENGDFFTSMIPLNIEEGEFHGGQSAHGEFIYHIGEVMNMANFPEKANIYRYHIPTGEQTNLYQNDGRNGPAMMERLHATDRYLYFIGFDNDGSKHIRQMDLETNEINTIRSIDDGLYTSIVASEDYVAWFEEQINSEQKSTNKVLYLYDVKDEQIEKISDDVISITGPTIRHDRLIYISQAEDSQDGKLVHIYNPKKREIEPLLNLLIRGEIADIVSNGAVTVWQEGYFVTRVFAFDHEAEQLYRLVEKDNSVGEVLAIHLLDDVPIVQFARDHQGVGNIYAYDLRNHTRTNLTNNTERMNNFNGLTVTADGRLIAKQGNEHGAHAIIIELTGGK